MVPDFPSRVGKYEILGRLGSGAMGVVYHARDPLLERDVALKVMLPQIARDPEQKHRFEREARAVARMMHPNVVTVFDLGYHADGSPYIAMEFLSGRDLLQLMRATPPLSLERKVSIVVSVLDGLAHAHKVGIVHRDIKPANVFLTDEDTVKIMDFGVARFAMGNITGTGMVVGTAEYMSPEQVRGEVVDGRSDLFSAGAMLYELIRGTRPFHADGIMAIFYKITHDDPAFDFPYTPEHRALIPILAKALAKDATQRYQSASDFAAALRAFVAGTGLGHASASVAVAAPEPAPTRIVELEAPLPPVEVPAAPAPEAPRAIVDPSPLFQLMRDIFVGGRTGHLHFTRPKQWRSLRFLKGQILHATSDVEGEHLGDVLVRYGLLAQEDLDRARRIVLSERKKLGTVLDSMGIMAKDELESSIKLHVREVLFNVTESADVKYSFEELGEDSFLEEELQSRVTPGEMILEAARRIQDPTLVAKVLGDIDRVIAPAAHPVLATQKLTLTPTDGFVLSRVDGTLTAREVFHLTPLPAEDTERSLFALLCTGAVEYRLPAARPGPRSGARPEPGSGASPATSVAAAHAPTAHAPAAPPPHVPPPAPVAAHAPVAPPPRAPAPPAAPSPDPAQAEAARRTAVETRRREIEELHGGLRTRDHFEILGIPRASNADEVKEAYFRLARPYHPDAALDPSLEDLREKRSAVFIRLGEAYETLRSPTSRTRYETAFPPRRGPRRDSPQTPVPSGSSTPDPQHEMQMAGLELPKAQRLMTEEKYWDAIQILEPAIPRMEATASRRARVLLARAYMKNPKWRHRAEELLGNVVREAPDSPEPYLVLGELYRGAQLRARAAAMYRKALQLSPRNEEALNALRAIDAEDRPSGGDDSAPNKNRKR
jgi:DnaJ-domain-containing protein 1